MRQTQTLHPANPQVDTNVALGASPQANVSSLTSKDELTLRLQDIKALYPKPENPAVVPQVPQELLPRVVEEVVLPSFQVELELPRSLANAHEKDRTHLINPLPIDPLVIQPEYQQALRHLIEQLDIDAREERPMLKKALGLLTGPERQEIIWSKRKFSDTELRAIAGETITGLLEQVGSEHRVTPDNLLVREISSPQVQSSLLRISLAGVDDVRLVLYYSHAKYESLLSEWYNSKTGEMETGYEQFSVLSFQGGKGTRPLERGELFQVKNTRVGRTSGNHQSSLLAFGGDEREIKEI